MSVKKAYISIGIILFSTIFFVGSFSFDWLFVKITINKCSGRWQVPESITKSDGTIYIPLYRRKTYQIIFLAFRLLIQYVAPGITITICNRHIISVLRNRRRVKTSTAATTNTKKRRSEVRLTKMIIAVSALFLVCNLPFCISQVSSGIVSRSIRTNLWIIANLFIMINVSANIVIYSLFNVKLFDTIAYFFKSSNRNSVCRSDRKHGAQQELKAIVVVVAEPASASRDAARTSVSAT